MTYLASSASGLSMALSLSTGLMLLAPMLLFSVPGGLLAAMLVLGVPVGFLNTVLMIA